jgi:hypothetical protein
VSADWLATLPDGDEKRWLVLQCTGYHAIDETILMVDGGLPDALPYVARVDTGSGAVWVGTGAAGVVARLDPASRSFELVPLPSRAPLVFPSRRDEVGRARAVQSLTWMFPITSARKIGLGGSELSQNA